MYYNWSKSQFIYICKEANFSMIDMKLIYSLRWLNNIKTILLRLIVKTDYWYFIQFPYEAS